MTLIEQVKSKVSNGRLKEFFDLLEENQDVLLEPGDWDEISTAKARLSRVTNERHLMDNNSYNVELNLILEYNVKKYLNMINAKEEKRKRGWNTNNNVSSQNVGGSVISINMRESRPTFPLPSSFTSLTTTDTPIVKEEQQMGAQNYKTENMVDNIFALYKSYFSFCSDNRIMFPELVKEAKNKSLEILTMLDTLIESTDLNEIAKIDSLIPKFYDTLDEFRGRAEKELTESKNSEGSQVLTLLAADTPEWGDFKKAYKLLKQLGKGHLLDFPTDQPISVTSKRILKQKIFNLVK